MGEVEGQKAECIFRPGVERGERRADGPTKRASQSVDHARGLERRPDTIEVISRPRSP